MFRLRQRDVQERDGTIIGLILLVVAVVLYWIVRGTPYWLVFSWLLVGVLGTGVLLFLRPDDFDAVEFISSIGWGYFSGLSAVGVIYLRLRHK